MRLSWHNAGMPHNPLISSSRIEREKDAFSNDFSSILLLDIIQFVYACWSDAVELIQSTRNSDGVEDDPRGHEKEIIND